MNAQSASGLCCPLCGGPLLALPGMLRCPKGHSFDIAKEGYANLLPVQKKRTKDPGDSKEMVAARHSFLQGGYYAPLANGLAALAAEYAPAGQPHLVDAGCGTGYYAEAACRALTDAGSTPALVGFDIARPAVRLAAKAVPQGAFCVAGSFAAPVRTDWADVLLNVFSPFAGAEFCRVLRSGGVLLYAVPTARHLFGLKQVLYDTPYENTVQDTAYEGFTLEEVREVTGEICVPANQVQNLFSMTPYYWKTSKAGAERLAALEQLDTEIGFRFCVYRRT